MGFQEIHGIPVWGEPLADAVSQMARCRKEAVHCALMADHHPGYSVPIGGVIAYQDRISPSGVGFDIGCGNKAIRLDIPGREVQGNLPAIMDDLYRTLSFGVGRTNAERPGHPLLEPEGDPAWSIPGVGEFRKMAADQLGTIGSGNHYVDVLLDEQDRVWVGVHFGSRGLGHRIATRFIRAGGGSDGMNAEPVLLDANSDLGEQYLLAMALAGRYARAGRDWVCSRVAGMLGAAIQEEIHNHHNFAWKERHRGRELYVVRKGATPAFPGQKGFVGGSMGDDAVIVEGVEGKASRLALHSTIHGAGRVMSRTRAAGRFTWKRGKRVQRSAGAISREMMEEWVRARGVELRGAGTDESPHCYKRLGPVLEAHRETIRVLHTLRPIGVAMAGWDEHDPYRD